MKNLTESVIIKANPKLRDKMIKEEQEVRDLIEAEKEGRLIIIDDEE